MMLEHLRTYELFANETLLRLTLLENQGYNNTNYLLESTTQNYLVRLFRANTFNRKDEFEIGKKAFKKKVAPKPLLLDTTQNLMIAQFGAGEHRTKLTPRALQSIARTLQTLHRIKHHQKPYDMLKAYKKSLSNKAFLLFKKLHLQRSEPVLCHHDLNPKNILFQAHKLTLIDWEYARINDRYFDLASIVVEFKLTNQEIRLFLRTYFTCKAPYDLQKLELYIEIYKVVCALWFDDYGKDAQCPKV